MAPKISKNLNPSFNPIFEWSVVFTILREEMFADRRIKEILDQQGLPRNVCFFFLLKTLKFIDCSFYIKQVIIRNITEIPQRTLFLPMKTKIHSWTE